MRILFLSCCTCLVLLSACHTAPAAVDRAPAAGTVRVATLNTALSRPGQGELAEAMARADDAKVKLVAEVLQRTRPDIVLLQEIDHDPTG